MGGGTPPPHPLEGAWGRLDQRFPNFISEGFYPRRRPGCRFGSARNHTATSAGPAFTHPPLATPTLEQPSVLLPQLLGTVEFCYSR